jgi:hypothetical protein
MANVQANVFKPKLRWLTTNILACGGDREKLPDLQVSYDSPEKTQLLKRYILHIVVSESLSHNI